MIPSVESTGRRKRDLGLKRRDASEAAIGSPLDSAMACDGVHRDRGIAESTHPKNRFRWSTRFDLWAVLPSVLRGER